MVDDSCFRRPSANPIRRLRTEEDDVARDLVAAGIDDLAKYHIVQLLYESQSTSWDAANCAARLGFHSLEVTSLLLDELVAFGVVVEEAGENGTQRRYRLVDDAAICRQLVRLYNYANRPGQQASVVQVLARHSLRRARWVAAKRAAERKRLGLAKDDDTAE